METPFAYLEESWEETPIDFMNLTEYVALRISHPLDLKGFYFIEQGFREKWNTHTGDLIGDGDFKNHVYRHLEAAIESGQLPEVIPQPFVDACVDLILDYLSSIGQWYSDFSCN